MATSYPGALDGPTPSTHGDVWDAVRAVQAELGTNPSSSASTVKARLDAMASGGSTVTVDTVAPADDAPDGIYIRVMGA